MSSILSIARYTVIEQIRNRLYLVILFFGGGVLVSSLLVGALAPSHSARVVFDLGLLALELFGLVAAVFGAVTLVLQEIESKTIYLIIARPIRRPTYIVGRFLGLVAAVSITMGAMALLHALILVCRPTDLEAFSRSLAFSWWKIYPVLVVMSVGKMIITTAIALFFSLFASSSVSALVFTGCFWIAGHFGPEITFLIEKSASGWVRAVANFVSYVLPNFQYFNLKETFTITGAPFLGVIGSASLYGLCYMAFFLILSSLLFNRKEF